MQILKRFFALFIFGSLTACVTIPTGPSVMVLPGGGKSFEQFRHDEYDCREYAHEQVGGTTAQQTSRSSGIENAAIGAGLGAIAGAALGGGRGAAIGAGTGLLAGGLVGSGSSRVSGYAAQQRYDNSYIQCMYAKGHRVPISGRITGGSPVGNEGGRRNISTPPPNFIPPPPPPGNPPPPPPR